MNSNEESKKELYGKLAKAITEALIAYGPVRQTMLDLLSRGFIKEDGILALFASNKSILNQGVKSAETRERRSQTTSRRRNISKEEPIKKLTGQKKPTETKNERDFKEYCASKFDVKKWLKELEIKPLEEEE